MTEHTSDLSERFPELQNPERTIARLGQAFITGEQAYAVYTLVSDMMRHFGERIRFGVNASVFPIDEFGSIIVMVGDQAVLNFHIVEEAELEAEDPFGPGGTGFMDMGNSDSNSHTNGSGHSDLNVYYQIGILLLDNRTLDPELLFRHDALDCREYTADENDGPLYAARFVLELDDLHIPELRSGMFAAVEHILSNPDQYLPYIEEHDDDLATLFGSAELFDRAIDAADFDNVIDL